MIFCRFFAVENGDEETRGRGAGQREAGLRRTFFLHQFRASRSIDVGVSVSFPCKVIPLSDEDGLWDKIKKVKTKRQVCPWNLKWGEFMETKTGLRSSTDRSWVVLVRRWFKTREAFRCSCVYFATQYNVHYDNRQAGHLLSALRLERSRPPFSPQQNGAKNHWIAWQCTFNQQNDWLLSNIFETTQRLESSSEVMTAHTPHARTHAHTDMHATIRTRMRVQENYMRKIHATW